MKKIIFTLLFLVSSLISSEPYWKYQDKWLMDYNKALELAKKEHKNIYFFLGADRCHFCKKFKTQTLSKDSIIKKLEKDFVLLYLNRDHHFIPTQFEKFGVPRHYFVDSKGSILFKSAGAYEAYGFLELLDDYQISLAK